VAVSIFAFFFYIDGIARTAIELTAPLSNWMAGRFGAATT
jgi:hypothetical protein